MELERMVRVSDIVTLSEAGRRLSRGRSKPLDPSTPYQWARRYEDFPKPITKVGRESLFDYSDITRWVRDRKKPTTGVGTRQNGSDS